MTASRMTTIWCDGTNDSDGHATGCPRWSGEGVDAREARAASAFQRRGPGGRDYSEACWHARQRAAGEPACTATLTSRDGGLSWVEHCDLTGPHATHRRFVMAGADLTWKDPS